MTWIMGKAAQAAAMFAASSIVMILINKELARGLMGYAHIILLIQNSGTLALLKWTKRDLTFSSDVAVQWLPCVALFTTNIATSMLALSYLSVPTFTVFRNTQPILATVLDFVLRQEVTDIRSIGCLIMILVGAFVYAFNDLYFHLSGYVWAMIHVISMSLYSVAVKYKINSLKLEAYEMSWYNNLLSTYLLILTVLYRHQSLVSFFEDCTPELWFFLVMSSAGGFCVSVSGFMAQESLSPTSWLTVNNLSKIPAIVLSCYIWDVQLGTMEIIGMVTSILGGYLYSLSKQRAKVETTSQV